MNSKTGEYMRFMNPLKLMLVVALSAALVFAAAPLDKKSKDKAKHKDKDKKEDTSEQTAGDKAKGEEIFTANCSMCHYADKTEKRIGPGLQGLFTHDTLQNGKPVNDANVREII